MSWEWSPSSELLRLAERQRFVSLEENQKDPRRFTSLGADLGSTTTVEVQHRVQDQRVVAQQHVDTKVSCRIE
jgi:hypothetical protein